MMLAKLNILKHVVKINLAEDKCLLEPYVLNGTCTVLMRGQGSNSLSLSDVRHDGSVAHLISEN